MLQSASVQILRAVLVQAHKGRSGSTVHAWRAHVKVARLTAKANAVVQGAQIRKLGLILARLARGKAGGAVAMWRQGTTDAVGARYMAMLRKLRGNSFLSSIKHNMLRIARGEACARLSLWRERTRQESLSGWVKAIEEKQSRQSQSQAVRQVQHILFRMVKGETSMRLCIWRQEASFACCLLTCILACWFCFLFVFQRLQWTRFIESAIYI